MFWMLFIAGIDEENYTENLRTISDMAVIFNFDEDHLKDWAMAVKSVLEEVNNNYKMRTNQNTTEAKILRTINYKTSEAKEFFIRKQEGNTAVS